VSVIALIDGAVIEELEGNQGPAGVGA
jgi:hypothetical protein